MRRRKIMSKNVIVLAMSTLAIERETRTIIDSRFVYKESDDIGEEYFSQMEPISKMILEREGSLDQIIILATERTKKEIKFIYKGKEKKISAVNFYRERMHLEGSDKVKIVDVEENRMVPAIAQTIELIRKAEQEYKKEKMNLWIDTQGGFRNMSMVINAIISLLKDNNIEPSGVYSINYNGSNKVQRIIDQTNTYKIFQFVSGINEFTRCGRAEQLEDYYDSIHQETPEDVKKMKQIAEAIQMCNIFEFDKYLNELREMYKKMPETESELLGIFRNQIRQDYGNLLEDSCTGLDIVEWFYKKKFYQQAITYVEAKLPQEWVKKGIIKGRIEKEILEEMRKKLGKDEDPEANMMVFQVAYECFCWPAIMIKERKGENEIVKPVDEFEDCSRMKKGRNRKYRNAKGVREIPIKVYGKNLGEFEVELKDSKEEEIMDMLLLYKLLKTERNNFNHMSESKPRADQETLGKAIKLFIKVGRNVYAK